MRRQREGGRTTKPAFEVKLKVEGSIGENNKKILFFFDSKDILKGTSRNGQSLGASIAVLSAKARLCLASAEEHMLLSPKRQAFSRHP